MYLLTKTLTKKHLTLIETYKILTVLDDPAPWRHPVTHITC
jgi:hypothetical protein